MPHTQEYLTPSIDIRYGAYNGTMLNSGYFWHFLGELYNWREKAGLIPNIRKIDHITTQTDPGKRIAAVKEILLASSYDYAYTFEDGGYITSVLEYKADLPVPRILVREPKHTNGIFHFFNELAPGRVGSLARYIGESYMVSDIDEVYRIQKEAATPFATGEIQGSAEKGFRWIETVPSIYTQNTVRYVQYYQDEKMPCCGEIINESPEDLRAFAQIKEEAAAISEILLPIDHIATRVFRHDREDAILEIVKLTHNYPWGAFIIDEMNSSTNPTRNVYHDPERYSPAKVFTAGNIGAPLHFLTARPSPTETFCLNFGRSLHHIAYDVKDDTASGPDNHNIDRVVEYVREKGIGFPGGLTGTREEGLRQVFTKRSALTGWVTEYVERFEGFHGFFTRKNVAFLTQAAGRDEIVPGATL
ncbi:MAG: hypothetical protein HQL01_12350 [Nitrospirae bacterium]|nr:hypothetical protein [Nitrospirota bacterium]